ncbi:probable inactive ATP-dependent zinc metalloprotease FTSHI 3, chloroplastic [Rutidosis leptorrhynchoides]|uniref:probable inactive ATP-dependent zinc metalloprotease FTSHI 3, chloroplastic n=1 Tax=Rutidosis leptorrhynchoides TaxID=125765 RepID=UPI003A98E4E0
MGDISENKDIDLQTKKDNDDEHKRKLWTRFRPKLWISSIWKKYSLETKLNGVKTFIVPAAISVAMGMCYLVLKSKGVKCKVVPYSELLKGVKDGRVTRVQFKENSGRIMYNSKPQSYIESTVVNKKGTNATFKVQEMWISMLSKLSKKHEVLPESKIDAADLKSRELVATQVPKNGWQFSTRMIDDDYKELLNLMKQKGTMYGIVPEPFFVSVGKKVFSTLLNQAPSWAMLYLVAHGLGGGGSSIARKPSKDETVTFDDVEGVDEAKAELMEIVSCLQGDSNYVNLGAKLPRGVLLVGPPGTGKTLLARAVAEKAGVPFFVTCASEFVELFVGRGASRIRDLFKEARKHSPSIVFIDELDAVGLKRGRGFNTEGDQTLNQLLTEMDGFESDKKVVVIAATNRPEMLDSALLRAGRFSRKVLVREPDEDGRKKILAVHFRGIPLEDDRQDVFDLVASLTSGLVGADLANIANESALLAARRGGVCVSKDDIMEAVERAKLSFDNRQQHREFSEQEAQEIYSISSRLFPQSKFDF